MEKQQAIEQLKKLRKQQRRMLRMYKDCNTKTYCGGNKHMQDAYNLSRLDCWENVKALTLAIKMLNDKTTNLK